MIIERGCRAKLITGRRLEVLSAMRSVIIEFGSNWHNSQRIDAGVTLVVVVFDVEQIHRLFHS